MGLISIIIPTFNRVKSLEICLMEINKQIIEQNITNDIEIIVSNDFEENSEIISLKKNFSIVKFIDGPKNGPATNRNFAASIAQNEWLLFIDDDCIPDRNILNEYISAINIYTAIQVFEGSIIEDRPQRSFLEECPVNKTGGHLWSCNFMIKKNVFFDELNGFDEGYPYPAMEDVDLNYRLTKKNIKSIFLPNAFVTHPWRIQDKMVEMAFKRFKSLKHYIRKHPETKMHNYSLYFLRSFLHFNKEIFTNAYKYNFNGIIKRELFTLSQLYFAIYFLFKKK